LLERKPFSEDVFHENTDKGDRIGLQTSEGLKAEREARVNMRTGDTIEG
jgi:hypothetical protein